MSPRPCEKAGSDGYQLSSSSLFPNDGGPTATHALKEGSPVIDAAVDGSCLATDQRGVARVDVPGVGTSTCDAGAFEFIPEP
jgi:hypothetical protein